MPLYQYIAKTKDANTVKDVAEADSREELIQSLRAKGLYIVSIVEMGKPAPGGGILSSRKRRGDKHTGIKLVDMSFLARNLAITLSSGIPLLRILDIISVQTESLKLERILHNVAQDIKKGLSLSEALKKYPQVFGPLWIGIVEVGEVSGNLPLVLEKLADYLDMRMEFERRIKSALIYPTMVSSFAALTILGFFKFILPRFAGIFTQFDIKLPFITQVLFNIANFVNKNFLVIIIFLVVGIVAWRFVSKKPAVKRFIDKLVLHLPLLKKLVLVSIIERFSSTLYILLESGVPIVYTLEVISRSVGNSVMEAKINALKENVKKGKNLSGELAKIEEFPVLISEIARIGEEAGNMPDMFRKLSEHYQKELSTKIDRIIAVFEPALIFLLGGTIGVVVVSLFLPLFKLITLGGH